MFAAKMFATLNAQVLIQDQRGWKEFILRSETVLRDLTLSLTSQTMGPSTMRTPHGKSVRRKINPIRLV